MSKNITNQTNELKDINPVEIKAEVEKVIKEVFNVSTMKEANESLKSIRDQVFSVDPKTRAMATKDITTLVGTLTQKIFSQELFTNKLLQDESLLKDFNDGYLDFGNSKEYVLEPLTGVSRFKKDEFVPTALTEIPVEVTQISFFKPDGKSLTTNARQWRKSLNIIERNLVQYFLSGKTMEFIANKISNMAESLKISQLHDVLTAITTADPKTKINLDADTKFSPEGAKNAAEAWVKIFNIINDMKMASSSYSYGESQIPRLSKQSDIVIFGSVKVFQFLKNMKAFIYHSNLFQPIQDLTDSNFFIVPKKYEINDENTIITTSDEYYLDDETLYIIDKAQFIKILNMLDVTAEQFWANNLAKSDVKHLWYVFDILPWGKIAKVTSKNLLKDVSVE